MRHAAAACRARDLGIKALTHLMLLVATTCCVDSRADDAKPDGLWRGNGGAATSYASGNSRSASLALTADAARQAEDDKFSVYARMLTSRAESTVNGVSSTTTTANQWQVATRYDRNITPTRFAFGGLDFAHDQIQLLSLRNAISSGFGYHAIKTPEAQWDLFAGLSYRSDRYREPGVSISNRMRTRFDALELLFSEESTHKLSESTSFRQRLTITPNIGSDKGFLAAFDSGLVVAINKTLSLKVSLEDRYNSLSQAPIKKNDVVLLTGLNWKFGAVNTPDAKDTAKERSRVSASDYPPPCNLSDMADTRDPRWSHSAWRCSPVQP